MNSGQPDTDTWRGQEHSGSVVGRMDGETVDPGPDRHDAKENTVSDTFTIDELPIPPASTDAPEFADFAEMMAEPRNRSGHGGPVGWCGAVSRVGASILGKDGTAWEALQ